MKRTVFYILILALCSCAVQRATTSEEFVRDVQKDLPFKVSELKAVSGHDNTYSFRSDGYIGLLPDYEVDSDSGTFHWDVSNPKLLLNVSDAIEGMSELSVKTLNTLTK